MEEQGELFLSLYLSEAVLESLAEHDPRLGLHAGNLQASLHLIEGVSHFRYAATWCTRLGRLLPGWREMQRLWRLPLEGKLHHIGLKVGQ